MCIADPNSVLSCFCLLAVGFAALNGHLQKSIWLLHVRAAYFSVVENGVKIWLEEDSEKHDCVETASEQLKAPESLLWKADSADVSVRMEVSSQKPSLGVIPIYAPTSFASGGNLVKQKWLYHICVWESLHVHCPVPWRSERRSELSGFLLRLSPCMPAAITSTRTQHQLLQQEVFVRCEGTELKKYMVKQYHMLKAQ